MSMQLLIFGCLVAVLCVFAVALSNYPEETLALVMLAVLGCALWSLAGFFAEVFA